MWIKKSIYYLICLLMLAACASQPPVTTSTPVPTPRQTNTPAPTPRLLTPTPQFIELKSGGFSLTLQKEFEFDIRDDSINMSDKSGELIISLNGRPYIASGYTLDSFLEKYILEMASRGGSLDHGDSYKIVIDGMDGIAVDFTGKFLDMPIAGKAIAVSPGKDFIVFGLGMSNLNSHKNGWNETGSPAFEEILASIKFKDEVKTQ